jgi:hypothetical protein
MLEFPLGDSSPEGCGRDSGRDNGIGEDALNGSTSWEPAFAESALFDRGPNDHSPDDPGFFPAGLSEEDGPPQGMWLTATAWLPPDLLSAMATGGGGGFGQGGALDELPPGPALTTFTAEAVSGIAGTGLSAPGPGQAGEYPPAGLGQLRDDDLIGVIRSYRRQASAAQAGELAAVAELASRRHAEARDDGVRDSLAADAATDEVAAALILTGRAAQVLTDRAVTFRNLPRTLSALATGQIDMARALVLLTGLAGQEPELVGSVEAQVIDRAAAQTTSQLRASLNRALLATDPAAADKRRHAEEKCARVEQTPEPGGVTAALTGRYLPVTAAVAAWNRVNALAQELRAAGAAGNLDELRVQVFLALLNGQAIGASDGVAPDADGVDRGGGVDGVDGVDGDTGATSGQPDDDARPEDTGGDQDCEASEQPEPTGTGQSGEARRKAGADAFALLAKLVGTGPPDSAPPDSAPPDSAPPDGAVQVTGGGEPAGTGQVERTSLLAGTNQLTGPVRLTGTVNLTVPLATLLGLGDAPGELGAFGPVTAYTAREIGFAALEAPAVRWCVTVTDDDGVPIGHGCAQPRVRKRKATGGEPGEWAFIVKLRALAMNDCRHERESRNYRPPPSLRHLLQIRNQRCTFAGCRMPAARCDDDHTTPYDKGGRTCECNLGPLCRHHHRVKQRQGWRLEQPEPGVLAWGNPVGLEILHGPDDVCRGLIDRGHQGRRGSPWGPTPAGNRLEI